MNQKEYPPEVQSFLEHLRAMERSESTIEKYRRDIQLFYQHLPQGGQITREATAAFKSALCAHRAAATVNSMLVALNGYLTYIGRPDCRVKLLRRQRRLFREQSRELTRGEYERLLAAAAHAGRERLGLLLQAICATGVRVGEVKYLTVEAARAGKAEIALKGKVRTILLPGKLSRKLLRYAAGQKIASGEIFLTRGGRSLSRKLIWAEMKRLCSRAGVEPSKVFPHNLRHLFARCFYQSCRDIVRLADVLGHSSVETTRIYLVSTGAEHERTLDRLRLIS
ncbi:tyrosine-type recombinase/integrase [Feifania hominis]|uniref:Tyrosine-type recombinase/integrase n=1 Tax=Feifania hominis TaxID=2763660 RepID=A0A926DEJ8_9FIRM|nr:tyrosine-type recombinase/integrase [Feifania hominis]MBC8537173.1 tyrosine-type recombinase/integrase [Feifania hominis]